MSARQLSTAFVLALLLFVPAAGNDCDPDVTSPEITCPLNLVVPAGCPTDPEYTGGYAIATDNCDAQPSISYRDTLFLPGGFLRIWRATDMAGNYDECLQSIGQGAPAGSCLCGDVDGSGSVNVADATYLLAYIFGVGSAPLGYAGGDVSCDGRENMTDCVYLISYIFGGGSEPCDPDGDGLADCWKMP